MLVWTMRRKRRSTLLEMLLCRVSTYHCRKKVQRHEVRARFSNIVLARLMGNARFYCCWFITVTSRHVFPVNHIVMSSPYSFVINPHYIKRPCFLSTLEQIIFNIRLQSMQPIQKLSFKSRSITGSGFDHPCSC